MKCEPKPRNLTVQPVTSNLGGVATGVGFTDPAQSPPRFGIAARNSSMPPAATDVVVCWPDTGEIVVLPGTTQVIPEPNARIVMV